MPVLTSAGAATHARLRVEAPVGSCSRPPCCSPPPPRPAPRPPDPGPPAAELRFGRWVSQPCDRDDLEPPLPARRVERDLVADPRAGERPSGESMLSRPAGRIGLGRADDRVDRLPPAVEVADRDRDAQRHLVARAGLDDDGVVAQRAQPQDLRLEVRLRLLGVVVFGVLLEVAEVAAVRIRSAIARRPSFSSSAARPRARRALRGRSCLRRRPSAVVVDDLDVVAAVGRPERHVVGHGDDYGRSATTGRRSRPRDGIHDHDRDVVARRRPGRRRAPPAPQYRRHRGQRMRATAGTVPLLARPWSDVGGGSHDLDPLLALVARPLLSLPHLLVRVAGVLLWAELAALLIYSYGSQGCNASTCAPLAQAAGIAARTDLPILTAAFVAIAGLLIAARTRRHLAPGEHHVVARCTQLGHDHVAVVALQLDHAALRGAPDAAALLEPPREPLSPASSSGTPETVVTAFPRRPATSRRTLTRPPGARVAGAGSRALRRSPSLLDQTTLRSRPAIVLSAPRRGRPRTRASRPARSRRRRRACRTRGPAGW